MLADVGLLREARAPIEAHAARGSEGGFSQKGLDLD